MNGRHRGPSRRGYLAYFAAGAVFVVLVALMVWVTTW